jgi:hypothetical protein
MPHDWRDSLRLAGDLALLGIVVTVLSLPLLPAGAAVGTGSYAIRHWLDEGRWPSFDDCRRSFRALLVRRLGAGPAVVAATGLIVLDVAGLRGGVVPGGTPMLVVVLAVAVLGAGWVALLAVGGPVRPATVAAAVAVLAVVAPLAVLVHPALVPVLLGYALFALHVAVRRLTAGSPRPLAGTRPDPRPTAGARHR